jgi:uncharacterized membrane protein YciS (DUF1049 family)
MSPLGLLAVAFCAGLIVGGVIMLIMNLYHSRRWLP